MQVPSLGQEDLLEKKMATHSNFLAWEIPWTEEPGRLHSTWGHKESNATECAHSCTHTHTHTHHLKIYILFFLEYKRF